jgi:plasmid stabilization system protein ParE
MRIRWTPAAAADLQRISDYLKDHYPHYRLPMRKLYDAVRGLKQWPYRGRPGSDEGTRGKSSPLPSASIHRHVSRNRAIEILRICHGAQQRP